MHLHAILLQCVNIFLFFSRENCNDKMDEFLKRCFYHSGQYDSEENFAELDSKLKEHEVNMRALSSMNPLINYLSSVEFYLSIFEIVLLDVLITAMYFYY